MSDKVVALPGIWSELDLASLSGVLLVVGAPDTGKSTFARWLVDRLAQVGQPVALLDGDVGQSSLGLPTTLTLALPTQSLNPQSPVHWHVPAIECGPARYPLNQTHCHIDRIVPAAGHR